MSYYGRQSRKPTNSNGRANPELIARIEKTITNSSGLSEWEENFLSSLKDGVKRYGNLTGRQEQILQRIEKNRDPAVQASRKIWNENYTDEMRGKMTIAAKYYLKNPPYFDDLARRVIGDADFVPSEKQYRSMVENKYVAKVLDNMKSVLTFPVGSMATLRATVPGYEMRECRNKMVMIIDYPDEVPGAAKGAVPVIVLPIGSSATVATEVRWLKRAKV